MTEIFSVQGERRVDSIATCSLVCLFSREAQDELRLNEFFPIIHGLLK